MEQVNQKYQAQFWCLGNLKDITLEILTCRNRHNLLSKPGIPKIFGKPL